jgi:hypothetical protein
MIREERLSGGDGMGLKDYMAAMDSDDPTTALDWLDDDIHYLLALPAGVVTGHSKKDFADYIDSRTPIERIHHVARHQVDGETEFVVGTVTEQGRLAGSFLSAATLSASGRLLRYESFFTPDFQLHPWH